MSADKHKQRAEQIVGEWTGVKYPHSSQSWEALQKFIALALSEAVAEEREAICKMIESYGEEPLHPRGLAAKIREGA